MSLSLLSPASVRKLSVAAVVVIVVVNEDVLSKVNPRTPVIFCNSRTQVPSSDSEKFFKIVVAIRIVKLLAKGKSCFERKTIDYTNSFF